MVVGQPKLRILCVHNAYQHFGGEDAVFHNEASLLEAAGHTVKLLHTSNDSIDSTMARVRAAFNSIYSLKGLAEMRNIISAFEPDVVHIHNFFPSLSPAIFDACLEFGVPSVWTIHNFRIACANGLLFRDGRICEDCLGRIPLPAVRHGCYRNSRVGSAAVATMIGYHKVRRTWHNKVTTFIALNDFAKGKLIESGLPEAKITVKPNFSPSAKEPYAVNSSMNRNGALFVGRLSEEKGVSTLISAWSKLSIPLTIMGDGPERGALEKMAPSNVTFTGFSSPNDVSKAMAKTQALIVPSIWYENFPMTVVEAMSVGTPIIASELGALAHIIEDNVTGFHFSPGDANSLATVVERAFSSREILYKLGENCRNYWMNNLSPSATLKKLEEIYYNSIKTGN